MNRPKLIVMCGLSGSGKSNTAEELAKKYNAEIVSSDSIREEITGDSMNQTVNEEVFKIFHDRVRDILQNQHRNVISDATNITLKTRRAILNKVNGLDIEKICYIIAKPYKYCLMDNANREHPIPEEVIKKQLYRFQVPFKEEGFDEIIVKHFPSVWLDGFLSARDMVEYDQKNPHHKFDLYTHCMATAKQMKSLGYPVEYQRAALLHDIGKLKTQTFDNAGVAHYYQHHSVGAYYMLCQKMDLDRCFLINYHMMPFGWDTEKSRKKWRRIFGEEKFKLLEDFHKCDLEAR